MKRYNELMAELIPHIREIFPWDLEEELNSDNPPMILDVREPYEFEKLHIKNSLHVPRGVLETACEWNYEETVPELVQAREKKICIVCRSGHRSVFAAYVMQLMGYQDITSLKTGVRGWNDYELPMFRKENGEEIEVDIDEADEYFSIGPRSDQLEPK